MRLSLQLQFQLPFPVNYKKMIRHLKCGMQFADVFGGILISDVRPNLPCGAGFMFATEVSPYGRFSFTIFHSGKIQARGSGDALVTAALQEHCARVYSILCGIRSLIEPVTEQEKEESTRRRSRTPKEKKGGAARANLPY